MLLDADDPTIAYPFDMETVSGADFRACRETLMSTGGFGNAIFERAAFLVLQENGRFECRVWPFSPELRQARWYGAAPRGTIAILHTHPRDLPDPSVKDRFEAERVGVPIFVLTERSVRMAGARGGEIVSFDPPHGDAEAVVAAAARPHP